MRPCSCRSGQFGATRRDSSCASTAEGRREAKGLAATTRGFSLTLVPRNGGHHFSNVDQRCPLRRESACRIHMAGGPWFVRWGRGTSAVRVGPPTPNP